MIYEAAIVWDGVLYTHECLSIEEAQEWIAQYPDTGVKKRVWSVIR